MKWDIDHALDSLTEDAAAVERVRQEVLAERSVGKQRMMVLLLVALLVAGLIAAVLGNPLGVPFQHQQFGIVFVEFADPVIGMGRFSANLELPLMCLLTFPLKVRFWF